MPFVQGYEATVAGTPNAPHFFIEIEAPKTDVAAHFVLSIKFCATRYTKAVRDGAYGSHDSSWLERGGPTRG